MVLKSKVVLSITESSDCGTGSCVPGPPEKCQATFVLGELRVPVSVHPIAIIAELASKPKCVVEYDLR